MKPARSPATQKGERNSWTTTWRHALAAAGVFFAAAAALLCVIYAFSFFKFHPEFKPFAGHEATRLTIEGSYFRPVAGEAYREGDSVVLTEFTNGRALLALKRPFQAEDYPFLKFHIEGLTTWAKAFVYWRRAGEPDEFHKLELNRSGDEVTQVAMVYGGDNYRGQISEVLLVFFADATGHDNDGEPIRLTELELRPLSPLRIAEQVLEDWTNPPLWQGYSNNRVRGIHEHGMIFPNLVANLLVVTGVAMAGAWLLFQRHRGHSPQVRLLAVALCMCLYGWASNDILRWHWRVAQLLDTQERYAGLPLEERIRNNPIRCARRDDCFEHLLPYF